MDTYQFHQNIECPPPPIPTDRDNVYRVFELEKDVAETDLDRQNNAEIGSFTFIRDHGVSGACIPRSNRHQLGTFKCTYFCMCHLIPIYIT